MKAVPHDVDDKSKRKRILVIIALVGSLTFGLFYAYSVYQGTRFPAEVRPLASFAWVKTQSFNGTEFLFEIVWNSSVPLSPLSTQLVSREYTTAVYDLTGVTASRGVVLRLPFSITPSLPILHDVVLHISVRDNLTRGSYTLLYTIPYIGARLGNLD